MLSSRLVPESLGETCVPVFARVAISGLLVGNDLCMTVRAGQVQCRVV